jgi:CubicO group peptidase (beta-lactamase class C family)
MSGSGLSASRLATMREVLTRHVARGDVPGLVALVARRGEVHAEAIGTTESGGGEPMRRDAIFRIASVSKPICRSPTSRARSGCTTPAPTSWVC